MAAAKPTEDPHLRAAQLALAGTPGGDALLGKVKAYYESGFPAIQSEFQTELGAISREMVATGFREGNAYARERGEKQPYLRD